jgi:hypothetical protein
METNKFSEQESMEVIQQMINTARNSLHKGVADILIFWGYLIAATALTIYIMQHALINSGYVQYAWLITIPGWVYTIIKVRKLRHSTKFKSYTNLIFGRIWLAFGIACALLPLFYSLAAYRFGMPAIWVTLTPTILLMQGVCLFASGSIYHFKPFIYGALACALIFAGCYIFPWQQFLLLGLCQIISLVIPGHLLNKKAEKDV